jgi:arsenite transporter
VKPFSVVGLLATVVLLFGFQGEVILSQPLVIVMIAIPLLIQSYGIFAIAYWAAKAWGVPHKVAAPCAMIGTSNFFELAVAVAIGLFGLNSIAALVTVVGVLVEVPVMLSLVWFANSTTHWFPETMTATSRNGVGAFAVGYPVRLAAALGGLARLAEDEG